MERQDLVEELRLQNPWWKTKKISLDKGIIERRLLEEVKEELYQDRISGVIGLRRVGKTTLVKLLIKELLKNTDPMRICYFSFDMYNEIEPRSLIKLYSEEILKEPFLDYDERVYFFFDEIQKVGDWGDQIKSVQDKELDVKFVITGSSSMNITKGAGESLAGRINMHWLTSFSFKEYLKYHDIEIPEVHLNDLYYPQEASRLRIAFKDYMEKGGLPELYEDHSHEFLQQILDLVFFRDIVEIFTVKRTDVLKGIFRTIAENSGQKINYSNMSNDLNTQYRTVIDYIQYLQDSFLVEKSMPYEKSHLKALRKNPKMYAADHSFTDLYGAESGLTAETIAFNHLKKLETPNFLQEPEVDIVLSGSKQAFEVKYTTKNSKEHVKNLLKLPEDFELYLVTEGTYDIYEVGGRKIRIIPLWLLLLTV